MKRMWLTLSFAVLLVTACTVESFPLLIPPLKEPIVWQIPLLIDEDSGMKSSLEYQAGFFNDVTVISPKLMKADGWLYSWARESVACDSAESNSEWGGEWLEIGRWMYANRFVASERRCAEGRDELAGLIETHAANLRQLRSNDILNFRMAVAHTLWQTLPEGEVNCSAYLSKLPLEEFMPVIVNGVVFYGFVLEGSRDLSTSGNQVGPKIKISKLGTTERDYGGTRCLTRNLEEE